MVTMGDILYVMIKKGVNGFNGGALAYINGQVTSCRDRRTDDMISMRHR